MSDGKMFPKSNRVADMMSVSDLVDTGPLDNRPPQWTQHAKLSVTHRVWIHKGVYVFDIKKNTLPARLLTSPDPGFVKIIYLTF